MRGGPSSRAPDTGAPHHDVRQGPGRTALRSTCDRCPRGCRWRHWRTGRRMRVQLIRGVAVALVLAATGIAHADNSLTARTAYYKERSTRVVQPMVDAE